MADGSESTLDPRWPGRSPSKVVRTPTPDPKKNPRGNEDFVSFDVIDEEFNEDEFDDFLIDRDGDGDWDDDDE